MEKIFVYIDDSGSPGQQPANRFIAQDTKIWAGVILSLEEKKVIDSIIEKAKIKLQEKFKFSEFHLTDIYSGRNEFKGVDPTLRLKIFELFVEIYNKFKPYVVVTCAGKGTLKNSGFSDNYLNTKIDGFKYSNPGDYALHTLMIFINQYLNEKYKGENIEVEVIIDEGRQSANSVQNLTIFNDHCKELSYKSSKNVYCLQFIDFIAFYINRVQNNLSKKRTDFDNEFMNIIGKMQLNTNLSIISMSNSEILNKNSVELFLNNKEFTNPKIIKYQEAMMKHCLKLKEFIENKTRFDNKELLAEVKDLKEMYYEEMSDEFRNLINYLETHFSDE